MREMLNYQADRIEAVLTQHRLPARVAGGTVTPRWIRFELLPAIGTRISRIRGLAEELAAAVDASSCRVSRQGATVMVEIPRQDSHSVHLAQLVREVGSTPSVTAILGLAEDGMPLLIRLPSPDVAHVLVAGTTGSGKTALLRTIAISLALRHPLPGELALLMIDPKGGRAFGCLEWLPQLVRPIVVETSEALEALNSLVRLMERRDRAHQSDPAVVLIIDELTDLMMTGGSQAERLLTRLTQRGREAGIHVIAATQKPSASVIGSLIKANFPVRLVGKVASAQDAHVASGWSGTGAERLLGRGDFIAVAEGKSYRFQAAYTPLSEIARFARDMDSAGPFTVLQHDQVEHLSLQPGDGF